MVIIWNNNNQIFGLNILCIIQVTVSAWTLGAELEEYAIDYNLRSMKTSPAIFFLFSYA